MTKARTVAAMIPQTLWAVVVLAGVLISVQHRAP